MRNTDQEFDNNWLNVASSPFLNELYNDDDPAFYLDQVAQILFGSLAKLAMLLGDWPEIQGRVDRCWKIIPSIVAHYQGAISLNQNPIASFSLLRDSLKSILNCAEILSMEYEDDLPNASASGNLTSLIGVATQHFHETAYQIDHNILQIGITVCHTHLCFDQSRLTSVLHENTTPMLAHRLANMDLDKVGNIVPHAQISRFPLLVGLLWSVKQKWINQLENHIGMDAIGIRARLFDAIETEIYPGITRLMCEKGYLFPKWASSLLPGNYDWSSTSRGA
jgi:hypothetical protein|tara:strand:- start:686 stop:1522 length:837 start_codon:yes stop_codon:yes gene_type:complete